MNKLMNKFLGEEVEKVEDEAGEIKKITNINNNNNDKDNLENHIVINKFKKHNRYNQTVISNNDYFKIYLISVAILIIFQIYFIVKYSYATSSLSEISFDVEVNNVTRNSEVDILMSYNVIKSYYFDKNIPLLNSSNLNETKDIVLERVKNITDAVEDWTKYTFLYMHSMGNEYMNIFMELFFRNITYINNGNFTDVDFLGSMKYGFRTLVSRYLSLMKTGTLMSEDNVAKLDINTNEEMQENGLKIVYVIKPWFDILNSKLAESFNDIFGTMLLLCLFLYIGFLAGVIVIYALIWKNIEFQFEKYHINSIELIKLIPERIKEVLIQKINEEEDLKQE